MGKKENKAIVIAGIEAGQTDDQMLEEMHKIGVPFTELRETFNAIIKDNGLRLTAKERKEKTAEFMAEQPAIDTVEAMAKIVTKLAKNLKVAETKAMGSLRTWAKGAGVDLPKAPKVMKPRKVGFGGHVKAILDFMLANRDADKDAVKAFCHANGIPEAYSTQGMNTVHFAKVWSGEVKPDAE